MVICYVAIENKYILSSIFFYPFVSPGFILDTFFLTYLSDHDSLFSYI